MKPLPYWALGALFAVSAAFFIACGGDRQNATDATVGEPLDAGDDRGVVVGVEARTECEGGASWAPCGVTDAAELACEASTDCTWQYAGGTCCGVPTVGVNKNAPNVGCAAPPCAPPRIDQPICREFFTQDCLAVDAASDIVVQCVDHRCVTRAAAP